MEVHARLRGKETVSSKGFDLFLAKDWWVALAWDENGRAQSAHACSVRML